LYAIFVADLARVFSLQILPSEMLDFVRRNIVLRHRTACLCIQANSRVLLCFSRLRCRRALDGELYCKLFVRKFLRTVTVCRTPNGGGKTGNEAGNEQKERAEST
jgi:hypothetical protein